jgi:hypothetical protein
MGAAEEAKAANEKIERLHVEYRTALRELNDCSVLDIGVRRPLIRCAWDRAQDLFNAVESTIVATDLLELHQSNVWATDLAATACNVLKTIPSFYAKMEKEFTAIGESCPQASPLAYYSMQAVVPLYHPEKTAQLRKDFIQAKLPVTGFDRPHKMSKFSTGEMRAGLIGIGILIVMFSVAFWYREYNNFNLWVFRVLTALGAGIVGGAYIPGLFDITHKTARSVVRATGGAAFFVVVYLTNPPALVIQNVHSGPAPAVSDK